ncbi:hypothetical protein [Burkholderia ubonensis]|uniref:hypothetical protein n=1 Tax=Burkholderia ubonensis TaxID=101571 RepID=UPI000A794F13|nr:hypothetical protein [Burkholderia ubonensis]
MVGLQDAGGKTTEADRSSEIGERKGGGSVDTDIQSLVAGNGEAEQTQLNPRQELIANM